MKAAMAERAAWGLAVVLLVLGGAGGRRSWAEDPPTEAPPASPPPVEEEEPELEGEAKREHEAKVKAILVRLQKEKNRSVVAGLIEGLGTEGTRAARDALIRFVKGNKNQEYVAKAFMALAKTGGRVAIEFLTSKDALRSRDFLVAQSAAEALAKAKDERAIGPLLDVMTASSTKIEIVGACALALAQSSPTDARVTDVLFEYASHRKDTIRSYSLEALGFLATDEAVARLEEALGSDPNTRARGAAATGLGNTGRPDVIPILRAAMDGEAAFTVKDACMRAISKLQGG